jgi:hypothetical protein
MMKWVHEIRLPYIKNEPSHLIFDSFSCHMVREVMEALNKGRCVTSVIPGGITSVLQPLDVCLNKPFKNHIRNDWVRFMYESVSEREKHHEDESSDEEQQHTRMKIKPASRQTILSWIENAWNQLNKAPNMVAKSFVVTGIVKEKEEEFRNAEIQRTVQDALSTSMDRASDEDGDYLSDDDFIPVVPVLVIVMRKLLVYLCN